MPVCTVRCMHDHTGAINEVHEVLFYFLLSSIPFAWIGLDWVGGCCCFNTIYSSSDGGGWSHAPRVPSL